jgi:hypothetical protein
MHEMRIGFSRHSFLNPTFPRLSPHGDLHQGRTIYGLEFETLDPSLLRRHAETSFLSFSGISVSVTVFILFLFITPANLYVLLFLNQQNEAQNSLKKV